MTTTRKRTRRTFLIPSIPDLVFAGLACLQVAAASVMLLNRDGDLPRHIAVGKVMLDNRALPREDFFSHTAYGQPFLAYEWLSQLIFAAVHQFAGLDAVVVLTAVVIASAYALVAGFLIRRGVAADLVVLTVAAAALLGMTHWAARPHAFSFAATAILLRMLEPGKTRLWLFVPLFAVWTNLHPGFLFGLGILGLMTVGDLFEAVAGEDRSAWRQAARYHATALGLGAAATLLNPYGIGLHMHSLGHLGSAEMMSATLEFRSPDFHSLAGQVFLGILLLVLAAIGARRSRLTAPTLLIFLATVALSLNSRRYIALFGLVTLPMLALALAADWERWIPRALRDPGRALAEGDRLARRGGVAFLLAAVLFGLAISAGEGNSRQYIANDFDPRVFPVDAVKFARTNRVSGRLYNDYKWGGYLTLAWPEQRVFIDGLADFYGIHIFRDALHVAGLKPGWRDVLDRWKIELVLVPANSVVAAELVRDPRWHELYRDEVSVLLERKRPDSN